MKYVVILLVAIAITGCSNIENKAKVVTDTICAMSDAEKTVLAEKFDKITAPNKIRVICE